jgi:hypothetical protein
MSMNTASQQMQALGSILEGTDSQQQHTISACVVDGRIASLGVDSFNHKPKALPEVPMSAAHLPAVKDTETHLTTLPDGRLVAHEGPAFKLMPKPKPGRDIVADLAQVQHAQELLYRKAQVMRRISILLSEDEDRALKMFESIIDAMANPTGWETPDDW